MDDTTRGKAMPDAAHHTLKTWPEFFPALLDGTKTFEVRQETDRRFEVGDTIALREFDPATQTYTGQCKWFDVTYCLRGREWGLSPLTVVLGIRGVDNADNVKEG